MTHPIERHARDEKSQEYADYNGRYSFKHLSPDRPRATLACGDILGIPGFDEFHGDGADLF